MLETSFTTIGNMVTAGWSLEKVLLAKPTAAFDDSRGNPTLFVTMAYQSIASTTVTLRGNTGSRYRLPITLAQPQLGASSRSGSYKPLQTMTVPVGQ